VTKQEAADLARELVNRSEVLLLGTINEDGQPNIKALSKVKTDGIKDVWCVTHIKTHRVRQLAREPRSCVYFLDAARFQGLMLTGRTEVLTDSENRHRYWRPQFEHYFPLGVDSPEYCVLHFSGEKANFAWGLINVDFTL
jgi:general stress protein 26